MIPAQPVCRTACRRPAEGEDVDYEGAAGTLDWDERGDSTHGYIGIWEFTADGSITDIEMFEFVAQ